MENKIWPRGKYKVTIELEVFGNHCVEVAEVTLDDSYHSGVCPEALAWKYLERDLILNLGVSTWECGCCIMSEDYGGDVKQLSCKVEKIS